MGLEYGMMIITHMLVFALGWLIQDLCYAGKKLKQVQEDFAETKRRFPARG